MPKSIAIRSDHEPNFAGPRTLDQFGTPHGYFMPDVVAFDRTFHAVEMTLVSLTTFRRLRLLVHHLHRDGALEAISGD
jgi:hypothetical protein